MGKSLTGNIYGDIEAVEYIGNKRYKCRCIKCGDLSEKYSSNLKGELTCTACNKGFKVDLTGQKYGRLTVISYNKASKKWICECTCGKRIEVKSNNLKSGNTSTCGVCGNLECIRRSIVAGTRPGQLKLLRKSNTSGKTGVYYNKRRCKWCASITFQGVVYWLGSYDYIQDAIDAREEAEKNLFDNFLEWYEELKKQGKESNNDN